jgi:hypothetical protein
MIVDVQSLWIPTMSVLVRGVVAAVGASGVSKRKPDGSRIASPQTSAQGHAGPSGKRQRARFLSPHPGRQRLWSSTLLVCILPVIDDSHVPTSYDPTITSDYSDPPLTHTSRYTISNRSGLCRMTVYTPHDTDRDLLNSCRRASPLPAPMPRNTRQIRAA